MFPSADHQSDRHLRERQHLAEAVDDETLIVGVEEVRVVDEQHDARRGNVNLRRVQDFRALTVRRRGDALLIDLLDGGVEPAGADALVGLLEEMLRHIECGLHDFCRPWP